MIKHMTPRTYVHAALRMAPLFLWAAAGFGATAPGNAWIVTKDGEHLHGTLAVKALRVTVNGAAREIPLKNVLSVHTGGEASARTPSSEKTAAACATSCCFHCVI